MPSTVVNVPASSKVTHPQNMALMTGIDLSLYTPRHRGFHFSLFFRHTQVLLYLPFTIYISSENIIFDQSLSTVDC